VHLTVLQNIHTVLTNNKSRDSSVGIALGYGMDDLDSKVRFPARAGNFSLHHRVQNGSEAQPASYPMGTRGSSLGVKRPGREADHSPPSNAEVKASGAIPPLPQYAFTAWCSVKAQGQLCLYLYLQTLQSTPTPNKTKNVLVRIFFTLH
jgi:hypothetical protein